MRRTTSALTTTILGAVLSASTVSAQQSLPSAGARRAGAPANAASANGSDAADADPTFGMAASRGPRYLLRNGLDYIDYQEYERALKYLREAEKRQGELNKAEKLKLTQAIERAQRGLRESIGSETPYALSQRTRRSGVVPAAAASASAARIAAAAPATKDAAVSPAKSSSREGDDRGEPIRLAAADATAENAADVRAGLPPVPAEPSPLPEIPRQPETPRFDAASAAAPGLAAADAPRPPAVTRIDKAEPNANLQAPAAEPLAAAVEAGVGAALAAQADLTTPFPELDAAGPAAPAPAPEPTPLDESVTLSTAAPTASPAPTAPEPTPLPSAPAPEPITLETPDEPAMPQPAPVDSTPAPVPTQDPVPTPAQPLEVDPPTLPPLGAAASPSMDPAPAEAPRVAVAPEADADLDLPALPGEIQGRGRDLAEPPLPDAADELPPLPGGPSGAPADQAPAVAPPAGPLNDRSEPVPAEPGPEAEAIPAEAPAAEPAQEAQEAPAPIARPVQEAPAPAPIARPVQEAPAPAEEAPAPAAMPAVDPAQVAVETPAPAEAPAPAVAIRNRGVVERSESLLPRRAAPISTLSPDLQNLVEETKKKQEDDYRVSQAQPRPASPPAEVADDPGADVRTQTQIDISRAPSPAEARPIRAIPVPEDWVPVGARQWSAQRKYWAAAATCHMPLYFQDPMLERYGHSVENFLGPKGRFLAYPVDKHTQSTQRNQIAQPFFSIGLFATQILALPYNMIMDPPWEAQYDLGYWRPGDKIPTDMYYLPLHGTGPPLKGRQY